ncbi:MAG: FecCD family ABC transporter permease [Wolinella sp.]
MISSENLIQDRNLVRNNPAKIPILFMCVLLVVLILCAVYALVAGSYEISFDKILAMFAHKFFGVSDPILSRMDEVILWNVRLPRIIEAIWVGVALASAGAVYQGCFRNPLVEPFILGASSGAALGAALGIVFAHIFWSISLSAFIFSLLAVALSYVLARRRGIVPIVGLILSGVVVSSIFSASVSIIKYLSEDTQLREITFWMMGGIYYASWENMAINATIIFGGFLLLWVLSWKLNLLSLGENEARSLGVHTERYKLIFVIIATLMTAVSVANVGIIAWIGLMMPHAARLLVGADHRYMLPVAGLLGAIYLLVCDTLARTMSSAEIPVGIITSLVGAPFLLWLLRARGRELSR